MPSPGPGSVEEGSTIVFTYSDGQALVIKTISFNVPYSPEEVHVEIYLDDTAIFDPTRGLRPSWRNFPRARQVTAPASVST